MGVMRGVVLKATRITRNYIFLCENGSRRPEPAVSLAKGEDILFRSYGLFTKSMIAALNLVSAYVNE